VLPSFGLPPKALGLCIGIRTALPGREERFPGQQSGLDTTLRVHNGCPSLTAEEHSSVALRAARQRERLGNALLFRV
jgi:hypothetical protein